MPNVTTGHRANRNFAEDWFPFTIRTNGQRRNLLERSVAGTDNKRTLDMTGESSYTAPTFWVSSTTSAAHRTPGTRTGQATT